MSIPSAPYTPIPLFLCAPIETNEQPMIPQAEFERAKTGLLKGVSKLSPKDRELFKQHIDKLADKLVKELEGNRLLKLSTKEWNLHVVTSIARLENSADNFLTDCSNYEANKAKTNLKLTELHDKIASFSIGADFDFSVPEQPKSAVPEQPKTARELMSEDPLWAHKWTTIQENMVIAGGVASVVRGATGIAGEALSDMGNDVKNVVKKACQFNSTTAAACKQIQTLATSAAASTVAAGKQILEQQTDITAALTTSAKIATATAATLPIIAIAATAITTTPAIAVAGKRILDQTGIPSTISKASNLNGNALSEVYLHDYLIPKEATRQYIADALTVANTASVVIPLSLSALKFVRPLSINPTGAKSFIVPPTAIPAPANLNIAPNTVKAILRDFSEASEAAKIAVNGESTSLTATTAKLDLKDTASAIREAARSGFYKRIEATKAIFRGTEKAPETAAKMASTKTVKKANNIPSEEALANYRIHRQQINWDKEIIKRLNCHPSVFAKLKNISLHLDDFCERCQVHPFKVFNLGISSQGKMSGNLLYTTDGKNILFLLWKDFLNETMRSKGVYGDVVKATKSVFWQERLEVTFDLYLEFARINNYKEIFVAWDHNVFPLAYLLSTRDLPLKIIEAFSGANQTKYPIAQISVGPAAKTNLTYPIAQISVGSAAKTTSSSLGASQTDMMTTAASTSIKAPAATVATAENTSSLSATTPKTTAGVTGASDGIILDKQAIGYQNYRGRILAQKEELSSMATANVHGFSKPVIVSSVQWKTHPAKAFKGREVNHKFAIVEGKPLFWIQIKNYAKKDRYGLVNSEKNPVRHMERIVESITDFAESNQWKVVRITWDPNQIVVLNALKARGYSASVVKIGTMTRAEGLPEWPIVQFAINGQTLTNPSLAAETAVIQGALKAQITPFSRGLTLEDLGAKASSGSVLGSVTYKDGIYNVVVQDLKGSFDNFLTAINHLKNTAKSSGASTLRIQSNVVNDDLFAILSQRYGLKSRYGSFDISLN